MTPLDFIFWAAEFALEGFGADYARARKIWPLFAYLLFRFWADFIGFIVFFAYGQNAFYWADWWQRAIQYPLMAVLLTYTLAKLLRDHEPLAIYSAIIAGLSILAPLASGIGNLTSYRLMRFELGTNMILAGILCLALAMRKEVKAPWGAISAGILIQVGSEALLTLGLLKGLDTSKLYPLGAIAALGMWVWAVRPKWKVSEARLNLGVR